MGDWETTQPFGAVAHVNRPCSTTIALTTEGMQISQIHLVSKWVKKRRLRRFVGIFYSSPAVIIVCYCGQPPNDINGK